MDLLRDEGALRPVARREAEPGGGVMQTQDMVIEALIEIPVGSRNKYEYDATRQRIRLDRVLYASIHYPTDYGFIPDTLAPDGDPLDILVLAEEPVFPGCLVAARLLGVMEMRDMGTDDYKIVGVEHSDPRLSGLHDLGDVAPHRLREIETFFNTYKDLEGKQTEIIGWQGRAAALPLIAQCQQAYQVRQVEAGHRDGS
jgi:inorganic pyrophosphatase